jgi:hypothetical protein
VAAERRSSCATRLRSPTVAAAASTAMTRNRPFCRDDEMATTCGFSRLAFRHAPTITDEPPPEMAAAGRLLHHSDPRRERRCLVEPLTRENWTCCTRSWTIGRGRTTSIGWPHDGWRCGSRIAPRTPTDVSETDRDSRSVHQELRAMPTPCAAMQARRGEVDGTSGAATGS